MPEINRYVVMLAKPHLLQNTLELVFGGGDCEACISVILALHC